MYADPAPVVFVDTCALLDVVRAPLRSGGNASASGAKALIARASGVPRSVWLIAADVVVHEYRRHLEPTVAEVTVMINEAERLSRVLVETASVIVPGCNLKSFSVSEFGVERRLAMLSEALVTELRIVTADDAECEVRAYGRVVRKYAPADRGKPEQADCIIIEHYLEFARQLRAGSFRLPICFVSSNTNDYGKPGALRDPLSGDFDEVAMKFVTNLAWAETVVREKE